MSEPVVLFEELASSASGKKIGRATLNSPKTLNSLTIKMVELLLEKLPQWEADENLACVIIDGSGEKAFCAGGDVQALHASAVSTPGGPCVDAEHFFAREYRLDYMIHRLNKPVIVWGDGIVMGGGLGILAGGSHRIVTETSRFAMPEVTIALFPDVGGSYFLNRMPGQAGRFLALTGASFNAADALYTNIATHFIQRDCFNAVIDALIANAPGDDKALANVLRPFVDASADSIPVGNVESHQAIIDELCAPTSTIDVVKNLASLETDDKWLLKAKQSNAHGSPLNTLIIDSQLQRSKGAALNDVFRNELILATNIVRYPEFAEGVRALLIDKDQNPSWQHSDVDSVPGELVESFFKAPWGENPLADL